MIHSLIEMYTNYMMSATGGNEMMVSFITVGVMGSGVAFVRYIPTLTYRLIKRHTTTTFTINNASHEGRRAVARMVNWLSQVVDHSNSRTTSYNPYIGFYDGDDDEARKKHRYVGTGYGFHWFRFNGKLYWMKKDKLESTGSESQKEEYTFTCFGRSHRPIIELVNNFAAEPMTDELQVYTVVSGDWQASDMISKRGLDSIAMSTEKKREIIDNIKNYQNNKDWFVRASLPHKLTYILYGKPGSGKTSLIKALATEFNMPLCILNLNSVTDNMLQSLLMEMPKNSILAIEDFDSSAATRDRGIAADVRVGENKGNGDDDDSEKHKDSSFLTLTGLLNGLDGLVPLDGSIIFLTTNDIESVDPALYRKGRVDYLMEMNELEGNEILEYSKGMFDEYDFSGYTFNRAMGNNLNEALLYSRGDPNRYIESLMRNQVAIRNEK